MYTLSLLVQVSLDALLGRLLEGLIAELDGGDVAVLGDATVELT